MNRPDFSPYVAHFTRPPGERRPWDKVPAGERPAAYENLVKIVASGEVLASDMPWTHCQAACFTECPWWSLLDHAARYSPYGIGFTKPHVFAAGGGPAIYLRPDLHADQQDFCLEGNAEIRGFTKSVYGFVTPFLPGYAPPKLLEKCKEEWQVSKCDYSHEREWRVLHDFAFEPADVQFIIVDTYEDMAKFPGELKDAVGRDKFLIMDMYRKIEQLWPTHQVN